MRKIQGSLEFNHSFSKGVDVSTPLSPTQPLSPVSAFFQNRIPDMGLAVYHSAADQCLWEAIAHQDLEKVQQALRDGANCNMEDPDVFRRAFSPKTRTHSSSSTPLGRRTALTALGFVVAQGWDRAFGVLAQYGADPWAEAKRGPSAWQLLLERLAHPQDSSSGSFQAEGWAQANKFMQVFGASATPNARTAEKQTALLCRLVEGQRVWAGRWLQEQGLLAQWGQGVCIEERSQMGEPVTISWSELKDKGHWEWLWMLDEAFPQEKLRTKVNIDWEAVTASNQRSHPAIRSPQASAEAVAQCVGKGQFEEVHKIWQQRWGGDASSSVEAETSRLLPIDRTVRLLTLHRIFGVFRFEGSPPVEDVVALRVLKEIEEWASRESVELRDSSSLPELADLPGFAIKCALREEADSRSTRWLAHALSARTLVLNWSRSNPLAPLRRSLGAVEDACVDALVLKEKEQAYLDAQQQEEERDAWRLQQKTNELVAMAPQKAIEMIQTFVRKDRLELVQRFVAAGVSPVDTIIDGGRTLFELAWSVASKRVLHNWINDPIIGRQLLMQVTQRPLEEAMREGLAHIRQAGGFARQQEEGSRELQEFWALWQKKVMLFDQETSSGSENTQTSALSGYSTVQPPVHVEARRVGRRI